MPEPINSYHYDSQKESFTKNGEPISTGEAHEIFQKVFESRDEAKLHQWSLKGNQVMSKMVLDGYFEEKAN